MADNALTVPRAVVDALKDGMDLDLRLTRTVNVYPAMVLVERIAVDGDGVPVIENGEARTVQDTYMIEEAPDGTA